MAPSKEKPVPALLEAKAHAARYCVPSLVDTVGALALAAGLYIVGVRFVAAGKVSDFHSNIVAEAVGVLISLAVAWLLN